MRELRREITQLEEEEAALRAGRENPDDAPATIEEYGRNAIIINLNRLFIQLAELETERLVRKARRLGIQIPQNDSWWWADTDNADSPDNVNFYLTDIGKAGVTRLIRDNRRASIEWWFKTIIIPLLTILISALGLIVALVSVSKK